MLYDRVNLINEDVYEDEYYNPDKEESHNKKNVLKTIWSVLKILFNILLGIVVFSFTVIRFILKAVFYIFFAIISFLSILI